MGEEDYVVAAFGEAAGQHVDDALDAAVVGGGNRQLGVGREGDTQGIGLPDHYSDL
jgi:hypothetical protein